MIGYNDITDTPGYKEEMRREREEAKYEALYEGYKNDHKADAITPDDVTMALRIISIDDKDVQNILQILDTRAESALFDLITYNIDMAREERIDSEARAYAANGGKE